MAKGAVRTLAVPVRAMAIHGVTGKDITSSSGKLPAGTRYRVIAVYDPPLDAWGIIDVVKGYRYRVRLADLEKAAPPRPREG